jgi:hypothetical protein
MVRSKKREELTGRAYTQKEYIAIVLDDMYILPRSVKWPYFWW